MNVLVTTIVNMVQMEVLVTVIVHIWYKMNVLVTVIVNMVQMDVLVTVIVHMVKNERIGNCHREYGTNGCIGNCHCEYGTK